MKNTIISISIPCNVYASLKYMADKDMRSARNYISKILIDHIPMEVLCNHTEKYETNCSKCGKNSPIPSNDYNQKFQLCQKCGE